MCDSVRALVYDLEGIHIALHCTFNYYLISTSVFNSWEIFINLRCMTQGYGGLIVCMCIMHTSIRNIISENTGQTV